MESGMVAVKYTVLTTALVLGTWALPGPAKAITCGSGVYRAGCAGPNGAAVVRKPQYRPPPPPTNTYRGPSVSCAQGVYRAGCAGPNGAAVVRKPY